MKDGLVWVMGEWLPGREVDEFVRDCLCGVMGGWVGYLVTAKTGEWLVG